MGLLQLRFPPWLEPLETPLVYSVIFLNDFLLVLTCRSLCNTQARAVNLIPAILCDDEGVTARLLETRNRQGSWGDTVRFIASSSALVLMTQNGNIYRPLTQKATCLLPRYRSKHIAENSNGLVRRQLAHGTTDEKRSSKVPQDCKYMHRKASRKTHSTNGVNIESRVT